MLTQKNFERIAEETGKILAKNTTDHSISANCLQELNNGILCHTIRMMEIGSDNPRFDKDKFRKAVLAEYARHVQHYRELHDALALANCN